MIEGEKIDLLKERAARQGALTTVDLREVLPVDQMSADELALVVVKLEEAGVSIELEEALMGSSRRLTPTSQQIPVINLPGAQGSAQNADMMQAAAPGLSPDVHRPSEPLYRATPEHTGAWKFVAAAGALIGVGVIAVFFLAR